ncbi:MAG: HEAT repeat domain-containing protein [Planctomycetota bacterium]
MKYATVVSLFALAVSGAAQDSPDFARDLDNAIGHKRFAVRRAAAGKLAAAGDAAVPTLRSWLAEHDRNDLPLEVIDAIARHEPSGPATRDLLRELAKDREFYWRSHALSGLVRALDPADRARFRAAIDDPAHLFRIEGARGLIGLGFADGDESAVISLVSDHDPRVRLRVALALFGMGDRRAATEIALAIAGSSRVFLDDPFGAREATEAIRGLRDLGVDVEGLDADDATARSAARARVFHVLGVKQDTLDVAASVGSLREPEGMAAVDGGLELRSCVRGDLFLRWTADGRFFEGLGPIREFSVPLEDWAAVRRELSELAGTAVHGVVICDYLRLRAAVKDDTLAHHKCAPRAVPETLAAWLKRLLAILEKDGDGANSQPLADRLTQFVPRAAK